MPGEYASKIILKISRLADFVQKEEAPIGRIRTNIALSREHLPLPGSYPRLYYDRCLATWNGSVAFSFNIKKAPGEVKIQEPGFISKKSVKYTLSFPFYKAVFFQHYVFKIVPVASIPDCAFINLLYSEPFSTWCFPMVASQYFIVVMYY